MILRSLNSSLPKKIWLLIKEKWGGRINHNSPNQIILNKPLILSMYILCFYSADTHACGVERIQLIGSHMYFFPLLFEKLLSFFNFYFCFSYIVCALRFVSLELE